MTYKHNFDKTILRSYDIRGIYEKTLSDKDAFMLGYFFGVTVKKNLPRKKNPLIIIGMDGRLSSPALEENLNSGLVKSGCEIYRIGLGPTPMLYFASHYYSADGAIQVTGSHNPKNYNGFKIVLNQNSFFGEDIIKLGEFAKEGHSSKNNGFSKNVDIYDRYIKKIIEPTKNLNEKLSNKIIVWDCGNGASGPSIEMITKKISGNHVVLYSMVDGNFPNHHPDPTDISTLKIMSDKMKEVNADIGIGFDGDGDRIGVIDKQGRPVAGDLLTSFLAQSIEVENKTDHTVILDIKSSSVAYDEIKSLGLNVEIGKTGHSNIKKRIKEINSPLAGEMSGHIFFADKYYGFDDALYASIRLLSLLANDVNLEKFISSLPKTFVSPEIKLHCSDQIKFNVINNISKNALRDYNPENLITIDGVRARNNFGWWLIRASNTEEALIIRFEGKSVEDKEELFLEVQKRLKKEGLTLEFN
ncbi:phosphomannomutase/phosphoglucomutase [Alphaproteobacteria bacterium]|nr:phosphomannomutase/phosphoglucomutase [Alphaproteobacteria bacterium]